MKNLILIYYVIIFLFIPCSVYTQNVIKVKNNYILIDTDIDIGKLNDLITISRNLNQRIETVGRVKLIRFKNGKSIAAIVDEFSPYHIKIGDYVDASTSKNTKFTKTDSKNEINKRINNIVQKIINSHKKLESYKYRNTIAVLDFSSESKEAQEKKLVMLLRNYLRRNCQELTSLMFWKEKDYRR